MINRSSNKSHLPFLFGKRLKQHNAFVFVMGIPSPRARRSRNGTLNELLLLQLFVAIIGGDNAKLFNCRVGIIVLKRLRST